MTITVHLGSTQNRTGKEQPKEIWGRSISIAKVSPKTKPKQDKVHFTCVCVCESHKMRPISHVCVCKSVILCDPMDYSLSGSSERWVFQARIIEWVAIPFSRDLPDPGVKPSSPELQAYFLATEQPGKPVGAQFTVRKGCPGAVCVSSKESQDGQCRKVRRDEQEHRTDHRPELALVHLTPGTQNVDTETLSHTVDAAARRASGKAVQSENLWLANSHKMFKTSKAHKQKVST